MKNFKRILIFVLFGVILLLPIAFYIGKFHFYEISENPEHWAWFGDYIGGVYSILVAFLVVILTYNLELLKTKKSKIQGFAEDLNNQIKKLHRNNFNLNSCKMFKETIEEAKLYVTERQYELFNALADNYIVTKAKNSNGNDSQIDIDLEDKVKKELKRMYN